MRGKFDLRLYKQGFSTQPIHYLMFHILVANIPFQVFFRVTESLTFSKNYKFHLEPNKDFAEPLGTTQLINTGLSQ